MRNRSRFTHSTISIINYHTNGRTMKRNIETINPGKQTTEKKKHYETNTIEIKDDV